MAIEKENTKPPISLDKLPSYSESLALDWTLSADETKFILDTVNGENQKLHFALQLKSLQNSGTFCHLNDENIFPEKIIRYLSKQLGIAEISLSPISKNSQTTYRQKIQTYLDYQDFSQKQETFLKNI
jgi:Domain of unknown function (DUF4158)